MEALNNCSNLFVISELQGIHEGRWSKPSLDCAGKALGRPYNAAGRLSWGLSDRRDC